ncbi:MAG: DUF2802 domain-containing protein [Pseudomonadota bacterium]
MVDVNILLLAALCLSLAACAMAMALRQHRRIHEQLVADLRVRVAELNEQVQMGEVVMQNQARRIERLAWELGQVQDSRRAPLVSPPVTGDSNERISQAIKLARRGESVESLMSLCALGRGEAELLVKLHYRPGIHENSDAA